MQHPLSTPGNKENRRLTPNIKGSHGKSPVQKSSFNLTPSRIVNQKSSRQLASSADTSDSTSSQQVPPEQPNLVATLSNMTTILDAVVKRMDSLENKFSQFNSAASSSSASERKSSVPLVVKSEVRKTYKMLLDDVENDFEGYDLSPSTPFNNSLNEAVVTKLIKEVTANNPQFQACHIRAAAYTYYRTLSQEKSLKQRGIHTDRNQARRRRERQLRKLQERLSILKKADMASKIKEKWEKILKIDVISSEESATDSEDVFVKPIPWRATLINDFFAELDSTCMHKKTAQAKRQRKKRVVSHINSTRSIPSGLPKWAIKKT